MPGSSSRRSTIGSPAGRGSRSPDFGTSTILLCTTDMALCDRIQRHVRSIQPVAAQMAIRQAEIQFASVGEVHERLKADGHLINNEEELKKRTKRGIEGKPDGCRGPGRRRPRSSSRPPARPWRTQDYGTAWGEARRACRPLRNLMFGYWQQAMAELRKAVEESFNGPKIEYPEGVIQAVPQAAGPRHGGLLPARHLLLHPAPVAHLEGLGQGTPRLPLRRQPGPVRLVRR